jgi:hypothetical protein
MYVTEFADVGKSGGTVPVGAEPANTTQAVSFTATAGQSAAFKNNTRQIRVAVDGTANIKIGLNPTAVTATDRRMSVGSEYFDVSNVQGQGYQISAVTCAV